MTLRFKTHIYICLRNELIEGFDAEVTPTIGDTITGRKNGTANRIFDINNLKSGTAANCVSATNASRETPSQKGIRGMQNLLEKTFSALQVRI